MGLEIILEGCQGGVIAPTTAVRDPSVILLYFGLGCKVACITIPHSVQFMGPLGVRTHPSFKKMLKVTPPHAHAPIRTSYTCYENIGYDSSSLSARVHFF